MDAEKHGGNAEVHCAFLIVAIMLRAILGQCYA
jgi:hypothetical protein